MGPAKLGRWEDQEQVTSTARTRIHISDFQMICSYHWATTELDLLSKLHLLQRASLQPSMDTETLSKPPSFRWAIRGQSGRPSIHVVLKRTGFYAPVIVNCFSPSCNALSSWLSISPQKNNNSCYDARLLHRQFQEKNWSELTSAQPKRKLPADPAYGARFTHELLFF